MSENQEFDNGTVTPGNTKMESTVRYQGVDIDDTMEASESIEV